MESGTTQTGKDVRLVTDRFRANGINPETGQAFKVEILTVQHIIMKLINGELQFEHTLEFEKFRAVTN